jgi:glucosyl-3-phosphoglycerate synthase
MPDFHQPILLPTLHHLADTKLEEREALLAGFSKRKPVALVIPALYGELEGKALPAMLKQLSRARYVQRVVISMNGMNAAQHRRALRFFKARLAGVAHTVLWNDGPQLDALHLEVDALTGCRHTHGKGSNVWMGIAHLLADGYRGVIACHDSDILNYDREMLWRLCLPVAHPGMGYVFAKSFYGRVRERMYGRVTRLLVFPMLQALRELFGYTPLLSFLAMFRYPLSGEFAADAVFLSKMGLASDWGLEIRMLCDVFRVAPSQRVCQVDLGGNFEHKHQHLGVDPVTGREDAKSGLMRMAREVTEALLSRLWDELGFAAESDKLRRLPEAYRHTARALLKRYAHEALFNHLHDVSEEESLLVELFARMVQEVVVEGRKAKSSIARLPPWNELKRFAPNLVKRFADGGSA